MPETCQVRNNMSSAREDEDGIVYGYCEHEKKKLLPSTSVRPLRRRLRPCAGALAGTV